MYLVNISKAERQQLYDLISINDLRKCINLYNAKKSYLVKFKKAPEKLSKKEVDEYIEKNYVNLEDPVVENYLNTIRTIIVGKFEPAAKLADLLSETKVGEVDEEKQKTIESYKEQFEESGLNIKYETFLNLICVPVLERSKDLLLDDVYTDLENLQTERDSLHTKLIELEKANAKLEKDFKKASASAQKNQSELKQVKEKYDEIKSKFTTSSIKSSVSKEVGYKVTGKTFNDILDVLTVKEKEYLRDKKYKEIKKILAAKYAVITAMEGDK